MSKTNLVYKLNKKNMNSFKSFPNDFKKVEEAKSKGFFNWLTKPFDPKPLTKYDIMRELLGDAEKYETLGDEETKSILFNRLKTICERNV